MKTSSLGTGLGTVTGVDIGSELPRTGKGLHMCMIYSDEEERRSTIAKYLRGGLLQGECVGCFVNSMPANETPDWITKVTQDIPSGEREGKLVVRPGEQAYCPRGEFVVDEMLGTLRDFYTDAISQGFSGARVAGDAGFILKDIPGTENFIKYEAQINELLEGYPITALCQYDANLFDGGMLYDVLRVHPLIIVNGQIVRNVAYQAPRAGAGIVDSAQAIAARQ
jgi:hypothetical protein